MKRTGFKIAFISIDIFLVVVLIAGLLSANSGRMPDIAVPDILDNCNLVSSIQSRSGSLLNRSDVDRIGRMLVNTPVVEDVPVSDTAPVDTRKHEDIEKLLINGVVHDKSVPSESMVAIIDRETKEAVNLYIGEEYKGWRLKQVIDRVTALLECNGEEKTVCMTDENTAMYANSNSRDSMSISQNGSPGNDRTRNGVRQTSIGRDNSHRTGKSSPSQQTGVTRNIRREFLKEMASSYDRRMQEVYAKPFVVNGQSIGMQVTRIDQKSPLMAFGIQQGDIIKSWNGISITSERQAIEIAAKYRNNVDAIPATNEVIVIRNGIEVRIFIQLR